MDANLISSAAILIAVLSVVLNLGSMYYTRKMNKVIRNQRIELAKRAMSERAQRDGGE